MASSAPALAQAGEQAAALPKPASGRIERLRNFPSCFVPARHIDVWLPEGYGSGERYNVIYMHDGQMLFDSDSTWNKQSWNVDETIARLVRKGRILDTLVVGIWNRADFRYAEYYPKKYLAHADKATHKHYLQTAQRGTSLSDDYLHKYLPPPGKLRVYSDHGDDALDSLYAPTHGMLAELLRDRGYTDEQAMLRVYPGRRHNENDWAGRVEVPLLFMMGTQAH